jgi:hypothetical protein
MKLKINELCNLRSPNMRAHHNHHSIRFHLQLCDAGIEQIKFRWVNGKNTALTKQIMKIHLSKLQSLQNRNRQPHELRLGMQQLGEVRLINE